MPSPISLKIVLIERATVNPDRWNSIHPTQYEFMPFGGGRRPCLGREKGLVEAAFVVMRLAEKFKTLESRDKRDYFPKTYTITSNWNGCKVALFN